MRARTIRRVVAPLALALVVAGLTAGPSTAITGNTSPDDEHPYVGLLVVYGADGRLAERCSGSLVSPTVFLTAGHCVVDPATGQNRTSGRVWFEQDAGADFDPATGAPASSGYPVSGGVAAHTFHDFDFQGLGVPTRGNDLGVVVLDEPHVLDSYAALLAPGGVDAYGTGPAAPVTVSGYGISYVNGNPATLESTRSRLMASSWIIGTGGIARDTYVRLSSSPGRDGGGTCFGDSGGPALLRGTDTVAAVTSFGLSRKTCSATSFGFRVDTAAAQGWLRSVLTPEQWSEIEVVPAAR